MPTVIKRQGAQDVVLDALLGQGGMAVVYRGTQVTPAGTRTVAIKRIADRGSQEATARLVAEGQLVFRLTHANICQVLDLAVTDEGTFLIMEYVDGTDLGRLIAHARHAGRPLDVPLAVHVARETARALDYAHRRTDDRGRALLLVHGDVTPQNILVSREGEVKLSDFGIARSFGDHAPGNDLARAGTPYFMPPEILEAGLDHRADLYALGVTLYLALGGVPFKGGIDPRDLGARRPEVGAELVDAIARATGALADRYATAGELEGTLAAYLARRYPHFTPSLLGQAVRRMAPEDAPPLDGSGSIHISLSSMTSTDTALTIVDRLPALDTSEALAPSRPRTRPARAPHRLRGLAVAAAALGLLATLALGVRRFAIGAAPPASPASAPTPAAPAQPPTPTVLPAPAAPVVDPQPAPQPRARTPRAAREPGFLSVSAQPWGVVYVDGRRVAAHTPVYRLAVAAGGHAVQIRSPDGARRSPPKQVLVEPRRDHVVSFDW